MFKSIRYYFKNKDDIIHKAKLILSDSAITIKKQIDMNLFFNHLRY